VAPDSSFVLRGCYLKRCYFLTDGIYPKWSTFVNAYPHPVDPKDKVRCRTVNYTRVIYAIGASMTRTWNPMNNEMARV
jgi:hypothetical protein